MVRARRLSPVRRLGLGLALCALCAFAALAAPVITQAGFRSPARTVIGELLVIWAQPLSATVSVLFSDGAGGFVTATPMWVDPERGMLTVRVPDTARPGPLKISVDGVESAPYYLRVRTSPAFNPGTNEVGGQVTSGGAPLANVAVILLRNTGCDESVELWDVALTDESGDYLLHGQDGTYMLLAWPPHSEGLAGGAAFVTLSATPIEQDFALVAGTTVNGSVVEAGTSATPIAGARVAFDGQGHEEVLTDVNGQFTVHLAPGEWDVEAAPPPGDRRTFRSDAVAISETSPQTLPPIALSGGVFISGVVSRAADGRQIPGAEMSAQLASGGWSEIDEKRTLGSGDYSLVVPPGQTYDVYVRFDRESGVVDRRQSVVVADADATLNFAVPDCAAITGLVTDNATAGPAADVEVEATQNQQTQAMAVTCADGSYRLRVAPGATGYVVGVWPWSNSAYAGEVWNNTATGTPFGCEGTPITMTSAGQTRSGIDFALERGAAMSGQITTQASGCQDPFGSTWVRIDDGVDHQCSLGASDAGGGSSGAYRFYGLPPSSVIPGLRACVYQPDVAPQCYSMKRPPAYTPVTVSAGGEATGIDFCIGDTPTTEVAALHVERVGDMIALSWTPTEDIYHLYYTVRGGHSATPTSPPGAFPTDPPFFVVGTTAGCSLTLPETSAPTFFLVTSTGPTGIEGPSGSYEP